MNKTILICCSQSIATFLQMQVQFPDSEILFVNDEDHHSKTLEKIKDDFVINAKLMYEANHIPFDRGTMPPKFNERGKMIKGKRC